MEEDLRNHAMIVGRYLYWFNLRIEERIIAEKTWNQTANNPNSEDRSD